MARKQETVKKDKTAKEKDKDQLLADVLKDIEKEYGTGAVMKLGERPSMDVEPIPSGSLLLDQALGIGGYPKGRVVEIYGPESSGKTTLALHAIAEVQKKGGRCAFIDAENAIDPIYARNLGVNIDELILSQIEKQVRKLEDVREIKVLIPELSVLREFVMVKIRANAEQRADVASVADIFRAKIVDVEKESLMIELTGNQSKVDAFLKLLDGYEVLELARTGLTGLSRGSKNITYFD